MKILLLTICVSILLSGCSGRNYDLRVSQPRAEAKIKNGAVRVYKRQGSFQQTDELSLAKQSYSTSSENTQRAKTISDSVAGMKGITKAPVVITGNIAIVGIELQNELTDTELIKCKNEVEKKVKATDEMIDHAVVTSVPELVNRIAELAEKDFSDNM